MSLRWTLFDLNGTLLEPGGVGAPLGLGRGESLRALDDAILASMADTLSGGYRPLPDLLRSALGRRAKIAGGDLSMLDEAMERAARMPPHSGAGEALERLRSAGLEVGVLTNSATAAAEEALVAAGLREPVSFVVGTDDVRAFKPDPRVYRRGLEAAGTDPAEACMVAAHWWDLLGAARVGMRTAWVAHKELLLPDIAPEPDARGDDLASAAAAILELRS